MNRRFTNIIRYLMDEWIPPAIRDSRWFMYPFYVYAYRGKNIRQMMNLKRDIYSYTPEQYAELYRGLDSISRHRETDLNQKCVDAILAELGADAESAIDIGCGSGFLVRRIHAAHPLKRLAALDVVEPPEPLPPGVEFIQADIGRLAIEPGRFDAVISCHVLEHLLDYRKVMAELVHAARAKVIFVVPRQRAYFYTLDEHVNFFTNTAQFAYEVGLERHRIEVLDGDIFYVGYKP